MVKKFYDLWKKSFYYKNKYCNHSRYPFYDIAAKYIPSQENAIIVDIGSGDGSFFDYLNLSDRYEKIFLLDGNNETIDKLKKRYKNSILYKAPEDIPFKALTVNYIHCSHLIEHLYYEDLYKLLKEMDRILINGGILVISTPLLWNGFYSDLSHIKPYNPIVFLKYFCNRGKNLTNLEISKNYTVLNLIYRYELVSNFDEGLGSSFKSIDLLIYLFKRIISKLKIKKYIKTGYTLVLKKGL